MPSETATVTTPDAESDISYLVTPDDLRRLATLVEENNLTELRYEHGSTRLTLRTAAFFRERTATVTAIGAPAASAPDRTASEDAAEFEVEEFVAVSAPGIRIEAPVMGTFYRTASPSDPPFVEVGDTVEVGQSIGLIEAMKVFSDVKSEVAGVVREFVAANKAQVQPGDTLLILDELP